MTSENTEETGHTRRFLARLRELREGPVTYREFARLALYDPELGYYTARRRRVGKDNESDFYTATTLGTAFGKLIAAAVTDLLGGAEAAKRHVFVEIGPEPEGGALSAEQAEAFAASRVLAVDAPLEIEGRAVVFSNELFDAQPFHRLRFREGAWRELGVEPAGDGLREVELPELSPEVAERAGRLPKEAEEGYLLDWPLAASDLLEKIAAQPWTGLFLAFDYGRTWRELTEMTPGGTARAYYKHEQHNDLLKRPGQQDLTCHVCWDELEEPLRGGGFEDVTLQRQESFFMKHAVPAIAAIVEGQDFANAEKSAVRALLLPGHLGHKFQSLHACRKG